MTESGPRRKLAAILAADVVNFSRMMGENEDRTLRNLKICRTITDRAIQSNHGRVFGGAGDSIIAEFGSPVDALLAATGFQQDLESRNQTVPLEDQMVFRVGLNLGDVIIEGDNLYGDGVNVAARLEAFADPGGITLSGKFHEEVIRKLEITFVDTGSQAMKNIVTPVPTFKVELDSVPKIQKSPDSASEADTSTATLGSAEALKDDRPPAIAVLPFANLSADPEQEYFADGVSEDIISVISRYHWLSVISKNSTFVYKGEAVDIRRVGEELQVDYVLEGSIRKAGARVRISTQLSAAQDGANLWSERYDRELDDIFSLQDEITETIAATIEPELARSERRRAHRKSSTDLGAWDLFQQAQWHMYQFSKENVQSGIALYQRAIAADDEFASAHAGLAVGYLILVGANLSENADEDIDHALESARRSVVLDDQDPFCHYALGRAEAFSFNHAKAESELKQAISMNPSYAHAYHGLAHLYMMTPGGDAEVASGLMDEAIRLSPKDPLRWVFEHMKGVTLLNLNRDDEALGWMERAATYPNAGFWAFSGLAAVQAALQNSDQAAKALSQALEVNPNLSQRFLEDTYPRALMRYKECLKIAGLTE